METLHKSRYTTVEWDIQLLKIVAKHSSANVEEYGGEYTMPSKFCITTKAIRTSDK